MKPLPIKRTKDKVKDYALKFADGKSTRLSALFGKFDEMILIHNMGMDCPYCTLWADGFSAFVPYFRGHVSFVLENDEPAAKLGKFAKKRKWKFPVVTSEGSTLKTDLGYRDGEQYIPGFSVLKKTPNGSITRVAKGIFGPGDLFCPIWYFLEHTPKAKKSFRPKYQF